MKTKIPTYGICNLIDDTSSLQDIVVYELNDFMQPGQRLEFPHRHSFFQLMLINSGRGRHSIDFETYPVEAGTLYCLAPGQVHEWLFEGPVKGYLINFNEGFFSSFLLNSHYLSDFTFFSGKSAYGVYHLTTEFSSILKPLFRCLLIEQRGHQLHKHEIMRAVLLQVCLLISRKFSEANITSANSNSYHILRSFEKLIEQHYLRIKLPKEYASLLFITPNHLNAVCKQTLEKSAGEMIRDRVILEAKRCLINGNESISSLAYKLNFEDNSYFTRFFKRYTGLTPEEFRKKAVVHR